MSNIKLEDFEKFIKYKAYELGNTKEDAEDLAQEGRIAAWQALEKAHGDRGTVAYVQQMIEWRMTDAARKLYKYNEKETSGFTPSQENLLYGDHGDVDMGNY